MKRKDVNKKFLVNISEASAKFNTVIQKNKPNLKSARLSWVEHPRRRWYHSLPFFEYEMESYIPIMEITFK